METKGMTRQQKEAVVLLSIGTFLEYFDLMLYVHMAVVFNELFFPQTDPSMKQLIISATFCITYVIRPFGAMIIGKLGDTIGRKSTIAITTSIMAFCCFTIFILPTYKEIGITASIVMIICRVAQGFSSLGESIGSKLYLTEMLKSPIRNVAVGFIGFFIKLGGFFALLIALFSINIGLNWRYAFLIGTAVACVGLIARTRLRETPEFIDYKVRMKKKLASNKHDIVINEKFDKKVIISYFCTEIIYAFPFGVSFMYLGDFMISKFGGVAKDMIAQNALVSIFSLITVATAAYLAKKYHPLKIGFITTAVFALFLPFLPYWFNTVSSSISLYMLQIVIYTLMIPASGLLESVFFRYFPVSKRFFSIATIFGISSPIGKVISTFGFIALVKYFGGYALWILFIPSVIIVFWSLHYFRSLEIKRGAYYKYPEEAFTDGDTEIEVESEYDLGDEYKPFKGSSIYSVALMNKIHSLNKEARRKVNAKLIEKAIVFARKWHDGQVRKTGEPFYSHPLAVASMTAEYLFKTDVLVAAILHDVVEDSDCRVELVEKHFNHRIAQMVDRLTKIRFENNKYIKLTLEQTVDRILNDAKDDEVLFIKQMDRIHNLSTIKGLSREKQIKMAKETSLLTRLMAIVCDRLNIYGKIHLENLIFKKSMIALGKNIK